MLFRFLIMGVESEEEMSKTPYHSIYDARCTMTIPIILSATVVSDRDDTGCPALWFVQSDPNSDTSVWSYLQKSMHPRNCLNRIIKIQESQF